MDSTQIRRTFLGFFEERDHVVRPSASLIPVDPTLLVTNAGMVPFKPYFLGDEPAPYPRAASVQKSVRTIDIDIIGTTVRHMSFFEMLGNFSFGDYFKAEAMTWARELLTEGFGLDPDRMWYTAYEDDDEAVQLWIEHVGAPAERVQRGGKDNFWQMGVPGPCGPSAEIFYDLEPNLPPDGGPIGGDEDRYVEIWNLVFMQNVQDRPYHVVGDLPRKNIDTGMGMERLAMVVQDVPSVFDVDTVLPVRTAAEEFTGVSYGSDPMADVSLRILADHGRTMTFLIGDGVVPSNDGRGYVLRRVLRRAVRHAWQLGGTGLVTPKLVEATVGAMGGWYKELRDQHDFIVEVVTREEERFRRTLESGHSLLSVELEDLEESATLPGSVAFKLHDTFGFPIELTKEIASEHGFDVDEAGFQEEMERQRARARQAWKGGDEAATTELYRSVLEETGLTEFTGYDHESDRGRVLSILVDGEQVERGEHGQEVEVFLDRTPFYAESGGQVGDSGSITTATGVIAVSDTRHAVHGLHGHRGTVVSGTVQVGQDAELSIDAPRRELIRTSHTGTHILHWALRDILGEHVKQAGSLVEAGRLRFDFSHFSSVAAEEITEIDAISNRRVIENASVNTVVTTKDKAEEAGALAFFGDKYGEVVRMVTIGGYSKELCGGTHVHTSGAVGPLLVLGESSIGSNLRRIEALTGEPAYEHLLEVRSALDQTASMLRARSSDVPERVKALVEKVSELEDQLEVLRSQRRGEAAGELAAAAEQIGEFRLVVAAVENTPPGQLRQLAQGIRDRLGRGVVVVGSATDGKGALVAAVSKDLVESGVSAGDLLAEPARALGGGGSRDPELAQAGGQQGDRLDEALDLARDTAGRLLREL